ncbi:hypothetical protein AB0F85_02380 [Nocardia fluminea]|uniref:hypothetical protein n=2 Tax=Nocardia fluminea TaxID=134984 RepID=UPI0033CAA751
MTGRTPAPSPFSSAGATRNSTLRGTGIAFQQQVTARGDNRQYRSWLVGEPWMARRGRSPRSWDDLAMKGQTSTARLLTLFGGVALVMLMVNWSLMRAVAFAVIWAVAAGVLILRDRRRGAAGIEQTSPAAISDASASDAGER